MSASGRSNEEEQRLTSSLARLTAIMAEIRNCRDIPCLNREMEKLKNLTLQNIDLWNWQVEEGEDYIILGLRQTIFTIPRIIESNPNFEFNFSRITDSMIYRKIKENVEKIFEALNMDIEVEVKMDVSKDKQVAKKIDRELNALEYEKKELEEKMKRQEEERKRAEMMADNANKYWNEVIDNIDKEFEENLNLLKEVDDKKREIEDEVYEEVVYSDLGESDFDEDDDFGEVGV